ncbi:MAG: IclR family transcriptional regulator [Gordonia sp. (in: high G+C Gram-positive bacteria)]
MTTSMTEPLRVQAEHGDGGCPGGVPTRSAGRRGSVSMVERVTVLMDVFCEPDIRLSLDEVSRETGLPRSSAHRILDQLVRTAWLRRSGNEYHLGPVAIGLGHREVTYNELRAAANSRLRRLADRTGLIVHLGCLDGDQVYYVDKFGGWNIGEVPSEVGMRLPAHCTSLGKAMLAWLPRETVDEMYASSVRTCTATSLATVDDLHAELARVRARGGVATDRGECYSTIACLGVAIRDEHGPVAAVSVVGGRRDRLDRLTPMIRGVAAEIAGDLVG